MPKTTPIEQLKKTLLANAYLRAGKLAEAFDAKGEEYFPVDVLIAAGDRCVAAKDYSWAFTAYSSAKASAKLIELGDLCANSPPGADDTFGVAVECFEHADAFDRLIALGVKHMQWRIAGEPKANIQLALDAFQKAHATDKLVELGDACRDQERGFALDCYLAANRVEKLIFIGDRYWAEQLSTDPNLRDTAGQGALKAYRAAKATDRLLTCARWYVEQGKRSIDEKMSSRMRLGFQIYHEIDAQLPTDLMDEVMDFYVASGKDEAIGGVALQFAQELFRQQQRLERVEEKNASDKAVA